jgi:hypothetical protein
MCYYRHLRVTVSAVISDISATIVITNLNTIILIVVIFIVCICLLSRLISRERRRAATERSKSRTCTQ